MRRTFGTTLALSLAAAALAVAAQPAEAGQYCYWNPEYTEPIEDASPVPIEFRDGPVCYVHPFPCEDDPNRFCAPR